MTSNFALHRLTLALAFAAAASACSAAPDANAAKAVPADPSEVTLSVPEQEPEGTFARISLHHGELQHMLAVDTQCKWLPPAERVAVESTAAERLAWIRMWDADAADKAAAAPAPELAGDICTNANSEEVKRAIQFAAWQMRITWSLRAQAMLDAPGRPEWFKGLSKVADYRDAANDHAAAIEQHYGEPVTNARVEILNEAARALASVCPGLGKGCPDYTPVAGQKEYAQVLISATEAYAATLPATTDKIGEPTYVTEQMNLEAQKQ